MMIKKINKICLTYDDRESQIISEFSQKLEEFFTKQDIESYFDIEYDELKLIILSKKELDQQILKVSTSYKDSVPKWVVGFTTEDSSYIVTPEKQKVSYYVQLATHELVHLLSYKLSVDGNRCKLLEEGLATYLSNQLSQGQFQKIVQDYNSNNLKRLSTLLKLNSKEFGENYGYYYSFFLIKFLKNKYSKEKIIYYIKNPQIFEHDLLFLEGEYKEYLINEIKKYTHN